MVELIDVFLENGTSLIIVCHSKIVQDAVESVLANRKVQMIQLTKFFNK